MLLSRSYWTISLRALHLIAVDRINTNRNRVIASIFNRTRTLRHTVFDPLAV